MLDAKMRIYADVSMIVTLYWNDDIVHLKVS